MIEYGRPAGRPTTRPTVGAARGPPPRISGVVPRK